MPVQIKVQDHLIIPFGRPKWHINDIKISAVSTDATYFESATPCVYIDKSKKEPLRLARFKEYFPDNFPCVDDTVAALYYMRDYLIEKCELQTEHEKRFLWLYFEHIKDRVEYDDALKDYYAEMNPPVQGIADWIDWMFWALMPLPQAHLYAHNPLTRQYLAGFSPDRMFKVDFAFWTGESIVAVEIDGSSHIGNVSHVEKDRMLARAGVHVIHVLNSEIDEYKDFVIEALLPKNIVYPWEASYDAKRPEHPNPLRNELPF